jgi:hypothetical protein
MGMKNTTETNAAQLAHRLEHPTSIEAILHYLYRCHDCMSFDEIRGNDAEFVRAIKQKVQSKKALKKSEINRLRQLISYPLI